MVYLLVSADGEVRQFRLGSLGLSNYVVVDKNIEKKEIFRNIPFQEEYQGFYDLAKILKEREALKVSEGEYLFRIETGGYPRFFVSETLNLEGWKLLSPKTFFERLIETKVDSELTSFAKSFNVKFISYKGLGILLLTLLVVFGATKFATYELTKRIEENQRMISEISVKEGQLRNFYNRFKDKLYILREKKTPEVISFLRKLSMIPFNKVEYVSCGKRCFALGEIVYFDYPRVKEICSREKLNCVFTLRGDKYEVRISNKR